MRTLAVLLIMLSAPAAVAQDSASKRCAPKKGFSSSEIRSGICGFNTTTRTFGGTASEQARCLLRQVHMGARIGDPNAPSRLTGMAGSPVPFTRERFEAYLTRRAIRPADVGLVGSRPVSARYFVIHDTSSPNCSAVEKPTSSCPRIGFMPPKLNEPSWPTNRAFGGHKPAGSKKPVAHAWTNRVGESIVETPYENHISHLKFDYCHDSGSKRGLFLGVENIQPRIGRPAIPAAGQRVNDLVAPNPGFTKAQYQRLAVLYAAASVRRGQWLIPAYHAVIDSRYAGGHDDPQNFDITSFDQALHQLVSDVGSSK